MTLPIVLDATWLEFLAASIYTPRIQNINYFLCALFHPGLLFINGATSTDVCFMIINGTSGIAATNS